MSQESTTPDLAELVRQLLDATSRADLDQLPRFYAPNAVWDSSPGGLEVVEGVAAIRRLNEDWFAVYEDWEAEVEELLDLGSGVGFAVLVQRGRPVGSTGFVQLRQGFVACVENGMVARITTYPDVDEGRAAAERFAAERE